MRVDGDRKSSETYSVRALGLPVGDDPRGEHGDQAGHDEGRGPCDVPGQAMDGQVVRCGGDPRRGVRTSRFGECFNY